MGASRKTNGAPPRAARKASTAQGEGERGPGVGPEERRRLARCCAFFKAEHFREAGPDEIREQDVDVAEAEIDAVLRSPGKR